MIHHKNLLLALIVALSIVMATGCTSTTETPTVNEPAPTVASTEAPGATVAPTQAPAPTAAPTEEVQATEPPAFEPGTTISYLASQDWIKDAEIELAEMFEAETGVPVDFQIIPSDQYFNVLETKLETGGEGIDIFGGQSGKTDIQLQLNVEKNAVPLTDEEWVQRMNPLSVEQISLDGVTYGLTIWDTIGGSWVIVYNKAMFADNDISVPKTYAEFAAACQTLLDAGITPVFEPVADGWHHVLWFLEMGPAYEAANPGLADALNENEATFATNPTMLT